jgi:hypothetical protein
MLTHPIMARVVRGRAADPTFIFWCVLWLLWAAHYSVGRRQI